MKATCLNALIYTLLLLSSPVSAASFDCKKASTQVEKMICGNSTLSSQDNLLAEDYKIKLQKSSPEAEKSLKADQRAWLRSRNACRDLDCLRASYENRRAELNPLEGFTCLQKRGDEIILPASRKTSAHLTVTSFEYVGDLTFKFTGTPINSKLEPYSEGCEDTDNSILVYVTRDDKPLFYRTGNIRGEVIPHSKLLIDQHPAYKKLGQLTNSSNIILVIGYTGNCGGCFSAVVMEREPSFKVVAEYYFDPAKYGEPEGPILKKYDNAGEVSETYRIE